MTQESGANPCKVMIIDSGNIVIVGAGGDSVGGAEAGAERQLPDPPQIRCGPDLRGARQQGEGQRGAPRHAGQHVDMQLDIAI